MEDFGTAVILCGGKSSRMGFDKSKIKIDGRFMIELLAEKLQSLFSEVLLVAENRDKFGDIKFRIIEDLEKNFGPAGGIYTGLKEASSKYVFFMACDMPFLNIEYIKYMIHIAEEKKWDSIIPTNDGILEPLYAFYSKDLLDSFKRGIEKNSLAPLAIIKKSKVFYIPNEITKNYSEDLNMFTNMNYQKDLEILKKIYKV